MRRRESDAASLVSRAWIRPTPARGHTGLGPHVVGQRVVVRRVLPGETGPSGGPAMTDVLGVCTAWGDGVVRRRAARRAPRSRSRLADIVSGKPVPPRASVRHAGRRRARPRSTSLALWPTGRDRAARRVGAAHRPRAGRPAAQAGQLLPGDAATRASAWPTRPCGGPRLLRARERPALVQVERGSAVERRPCAAGWAPPSATATPTSCSPRVARALRVAVPARRRRRRGRRVDERRGVGRGPSSWRRRRGRARRRWTATGSACTASASTRRTAAAGWPPRCSPRCSSGAPSRARPRPGCTSRPTTSRRCALYERLGLRAPTTPTATWRRAR